MSNGIVLALLHPGSLVDLVPRDREDRRAAGWADCGLQI